MKVDIFKYVVVCEVCQRVKVEYKRSAGLLKLLEISEWNWEYIIMDFVVGLFRFFRGSDVIWVVVDRLIKSAYFIFMKIINLVSDLVFLYMKEVVSFYGVFKFIVSDRDFNFVFNFWESFYSVLGIKFSFSVVFYFQTDGQSERII